MINRVGRCEDDVVMAVLADIGGKDMRRVLANRVAAVVTAETVADNIDVVEISR